MWNALMKLFVRPACAEPACRGIEALERRTLLSVAPAALTDQELLDAIARHTLTPEQMAALDFVETEWEGRQVYQKAGEWIVGFEHEPPTFDARGNLVDLNIEFTGPTTPVAPELQQRFDQLGLGIRFDEYLGVTHQMVIDVPRDVTFERLNETLQRLPDFAYVEPNAASFVPVGGTPNSPGIPVVPPGGAVAVSVNRGVLSIRGDGSANAVTIVAGSAPGEFVVSGAAGTTVNGQAGPVTLAGVTRGLRAKLGAGDDRLNVTAPALPGNVSLDLGRGADALTLDGVAVGRNLAVRGAAGAKTLDLSNVAVAGRTKIATGRDADALNLADSTFSGKAAIKTGAGNDAVTGAAVFAAGRSINDGPGEDTVTLAEGVSLTFDFGDGEQGWVAGFADYDPGNERFDSGLRPLPAELNTSGTGFMLGGLNLSDDLFMFLKRRLGPEDGIVPAQPYRLAYTITFASDAPSGADGAGGSPGEGVHLKAGGSGIEPVQVLDALGDVRLNVDKGNQLANGPAASVIGGIGNGLPLVDSTPIPYVSLVRRHVHDTPVAASPSGDLWLLVGTESGFAGGTVLYYQRIEVSLIPVEAGAAV